MSWGFLGMLFYTEFLPADLDLFHMDLFRTLHRDLRTSIPPSLKDNAIIFNVVWSTIWLTEESTRKLQRKYKKSFG